MSATKRPAYADLSVEAQRYVDDQFGLFDGKVSKDHLIALAWHNVIKGGASDITESLQSLDEELKDIYDVTAMLGQKLVDQIDTDEVNADAEAFDKSDAEATAQ